MLVRRRWLSWRTRSGAAAYGTDSSVLTRCAPWRSGSVSSARYVMHVKSTPCGLLVPCGDPHRGADGESRPWVLASSLCRSRHLIRRLESARKTERRSADPTGERTTRSSKRAPRRSAWPAGPGQRATERSETMRVETRAIVQTPSGQFSARKIGQMLPGQSPGMRGRTDASEKRALVESRGQVYCQLFDQLIAVIRLAVPALFFFDHASTDLPVSGGDDGIDGTRRRSPGLLQQSHDTIESGLYAPGFTSAIL